MFFQTGHRTALLGVDVDYELDSGVEFSKIDLACIRIVIVVRMGPPRTDNPMPSSYRPRSLL